MENRSFLWQTLILLASSPWDKKFAFVGKIAVFHFFTGGGRLELCRAVGFGAVFPNSPGPTTTVVNFLFKFFKEQQPKRRKQNNPIALLPPL